MSEDYSLYEKIDFYLKGKLSKEEKIAFAKEMEQDESLRQKVESQDIANTVILTKQLLRLQGKINQDLKTQSNFGSYKWILSLTIATIVASASIYLFNNKTHQKQSAERVILIKDSINILSKNNEVEDIVPLPSLKTKATENTLPDIAAKTADSISVIAPMIKMEDEIISSTSYTTTNVENETATQTKIDCSVLSLEDAVSTMPACVGEQNGKIKIITSYIKGGKAPYLFSISKRPNYKTDTEFLYLNAGNYLVSAKDNNGCIIEKEIEVEEKFCTSVKAYAFSPDFEKWEIPVKQNKQGEIRIFNKSGILVYNSRIGEGFENSWDGKSLEGKILDSGYFVYVLKYNEGEEERGSVTIR